MSSVQIFSLWCSLSGILYVITIRFGSTMNDDMIEVQLEEEPIELCKLLKVLDLAEGGGHAKLLIADGYVGVNGEVCTQKRKKMRAGDTLYFNGELFALSAAENMVQRQPKPHPEAKTHTPAIKQKAKKPQRDERTGRKPISFG